RGAAPAPRPGRCSRSRHPPQAHGPQAFSAGSAPDLSSRSRAGALPSGPCPPLPAAPRPGGGESPRRGRAPRVAEIRARLAPRYPAVTTALDHRSAWELLVATILSAQSTDVVVNQITPE